MKMQKQATFGDTWTLKITNKSRPDGVTWRKIRQKGQLLTCIVVALPQALLAQENYRRLLTSLPPSSVLNLHEEKQRPCGLRAPGSSNKLFRMSYESCCTMLYHSQGPIMHEHCLGGEGNKKTLVMHKTQRESPTLLRSYPQANCCENVVLVLRALQLVRRCRILPSNQAKVESLLPGSPLKGLYRRA